MAMLKIWFMYDNHTFAKVTDRSRGGLIQAAKELFGEDGCGALFVRDEHDCELYALTLNGHRQSDGRYGVLDREVEEWADKILVEESFRQVMVG